MPFSFAIAPAPPQVMTLPAILPHHYKGKEPSVTTWLAHQLGT